MPGWTQCEPNAPHLRIIEADPAITEYADALYIPFQGYGLDDDPRWGLYDRDGRLIPEAAYCRGPDRIPVGQGHATPADFDAAVHAPDDHHIYAGPLIPHYGHYLLATLPHLWPFADGTGPAGPLLWHSHHDLAVLPSLPYAGRTLDALGLPATRFRRFTRPTRLKHVSVITPAFEEENLAHRAYGHLCRTIGNRLAPDAPASARPPAYLARTRLDFAIKTLANEAALADALAHMGVEIIHPERLDLADQVALFGSDRVVMGLAGSAFHTAVFAPPRARLLLLDIANGWNQALIGRLTGHRTVRLRPLEPLPYTDGTSSKGRLYTLPDPLGTAGELMRHTQALASSP